MTGAEGQQSPSWPLPDPDPSRPCRQQLTWLAGLLVCMVLAGALWLGTYAYRPAGLEQAATVLIPKGASVREIRGILAGRRLLSEDVRFLLLAKLTGSAGRLQAGEYLIPPEATPLQILTLLEQGKMIRATATIPEGLNLAEIAALLAADHWVDAQRFTALARDREFIRTLGLDQATLEGYLFPDTYVLTRGDMSEEAILEMMTRRFLAVWQDLTGGGIPAMPRHQIITLASIVEKETGAPAERPLIARVFFNRLQLGMRLQSDPTVIYGLTDFDGDLTGEHLRLATPYNTYVIHGLPPGPICSPGREAMAAVLRPAASPHLFFVSRNDGTHYFSTTLAEHNRAVRTYQKRKKQEKKKKSKAVGVTTGKG